MTLGEPLNLPILPIQGCGNAPASVCPKPIWIITPLTLKHIIDMNLHQHIDITELPTNDA